MKRNLTILIGGLLIVIVAVALGFNRVTQAQDTTAESEAAFTVERSALVQIGDLAETVSATGTVNPIREVTLSFQSQAVVTEILVSEGDRVQAGDILARIDARTFDERLQDAQVQLELAQVDLTDLTGPARDVDIAAAEAAVRAAQLALGPGTPISGPDSVAAQLEAVELDLAKNLNWQVQQRNEDFDAGLDAAWLRLQRTEKGTDEWEEARQDYYAAEARVVLNDADVQSSLRTVDVAIAEYDAEMERPATYAGSSNAYAQRTQAEIELNDLIGPPDAVDLAFAELDVAIAESNLEYVRELATQALIVAPFDGVIAEMNLTQGALPPANALVMVDDSTFEIVVAVDELDIARVDPAQTVSIELDALPGQTVMGLVDNVAMTPTLRGDVVTYDVRITLNTADVLVRSGMSGRAWIATEMAENVTFVPTQFVRFVESLDQDVVVVQVDDTTFDLRLVAVGIQTATDSQILTGVEAGETVVLLPSSDLMSLVDDFVQARNLDQQ